MRRYKKKHRESLDRHERELTDDFEKYKKGRASKSPTSPDIDEAESDTEVFENEYEAVENENEAQIQPESETQSVRSGDSSSEIQAASKSQLTEIQATSKSQLTGNPPVKRSKVKGKSPSKSKGKSQPKNKPKSNSDKKSPKGKNVKLSLCSYPFNSAKLLKSPSSSESRFDPTKAGIW